jgi:hypothetical protein
MNFFSEILKSALPTKGLMIREATLNAPTRTPISASLEPNLERKIGKVGMRMQKTKEDTNWAKKLITKSRVNIFMDDISFLLILYFIADL